MSYLDIPECEASIDEQLTMLGLLFLHGVPVYDYTYATCCLHRSLYLMQDHAHTIVFTCRQLVLAPVERTDGSSSKYGWILGHTRTLTKGWLLTRAVIYKRPITLTMGFDCGKREPVLLKDVLGKREHVLLKDVLHGHIPEDSKLYNEPYQINIHELLDRARSTNEIT